MLTGLVFIRASEERVAAGGKRRVQNVEEMIQRVRDEGKHKKNGTPARAVPGPAGNHKTKNKEKDASFPRRRRASTVKAGKLNCTDLCSIHQESSETGRVGARGGIAITGNGADRPRVSPIILLYYPDLYSPL